MTTAIVIALAFVGAIPVACIIVGARAEESLEESKSPWES